MSLPTRERGLKYIWDVDTGSWVESLPTRERGLKLIQQIAFDGEDVVAPHAGAWIEITTITS